MMAERTSSSGALQVPLPGPIARLAAPTRRGSLPGSTFDAAPGAGSASASLLARKALLASGPGQPAATDGTRTPRLSTQGTQSGMGAMQQPSRSASLSGFEPQLGATQSPRASISGAIPLRVSSNGSIAGDLSAYSLRRMSCTNNSLVQRARQSHIKQLGIKDFVAHHFWTHYEKYKVAHIRALHEALNPPLGQPKGISGSYGAMGWGIMGNAVDMHVEQKLEEMKAAEAALPLQREELVTQYGKWLESMTREESAAVVIQRWWRAWLDFRRVMWPDQFAELPKVDKPAPYVWSSSSEEEDDDDEGHPALPVLPTRKKPGNVAGFGTSAVKPMNRSGSKASSLPVSATTTETGAVNMTLGGSKPQPGQGVSNNLIWSSAAPHHTERRGPATARYLDGVSDSGYQNPRRRPKVAKPHRQHKIKLATAPPDAPEPADPFDHDIVAAEPSSPTLRSQHSYGTQRSQASCASLKSHPSRQASFAALQGLLASQDAQGDVQLPAIDLFGTDSDSDTAGESIGPHARRAHRHHGRSRVRYAHGPVLGHLKFWGTLQNPREQYDSRFFLPHLGEVHLLESERDMFNGTVHIRAVSKVLKPTSDQSQEGPDQVHIIEPPPAPLHKSGLTAHVVSCQRLSKAKSNGEVPQPSSRRPPRTAAAPGSPKWVRQMHAQYLGPGSPYRSLDVAQSRRGRRQLGSPGASRPFTVPAPMHQQQSGQATADKDSLTLISHALVTHRTQDSCAGHLPLLPEHVHAVPRNAAVSPAAASAPAPPQPPQPPLPAQQLAQEVDAGSLKPVQVPVTSEHVQEAGSIAMHMEEVMTVMKPVSRQGESGARTPVPLPIQSLTFTRGKRIDSSEPSQQHVRYPSRGGQPPPAAAAASSQLLPGVAGQARDVVAAATGMWVDEALSSRAGSPHREASMDAVCDELGSGHHPPGSALPASNHNAHYRDEQEELFEQYGIPHLRPLLASAGPTNLDSAALVATPPPVSSALHPRSAGVLMPARGRTAPSAVSFNKAQTGSLAVVPGRTVGKGIQMERATRKPLLGRSFVHVPAPPPAYKNPNLKLHSSRPFQPPGPLQPSVHPYVAYLPVQPLVPSQPAHRLPPPGPRILLQQNHFSTSGFILGIPATHQTNT